MAWWEILVGIILFIVALGVLIGIHELGHLAAAKAFNVYCFNYSIGFGPKLISSTRDEKHETIWTLRAIPLGGFVSMYGEGMDTEGEFIPPSRSLEGIARYKRAVIISAGVFLNFILGFVLIFIHNSCFPRIYFSFPSVKNSQNVYQTVMVCNYNDSLEEKGLVDGDAIKVQMDPFAGVFLIDDNLKIGDAEGYVLCMSNLVTTTKSDPRLSDSLVIYAKKDLNIAINESIEKGYSDNRLVSFILSNDPNLDEEKVKEEVKELSKDKEKRNERYKKEVEDYYHKRDYQYTVDLDKQYHTDKTTNIDAKFIVYHSKTDVKDITINVKPEGKSSFINNGISLKRFFHYRNGGEMFSDSWNEWCGANTAVFRGLGMLFTGSGDVSGPIGIAKMSTSVLANFGFERYLYLWGMISCNLAILNLLPFPGLDGWSLVVIGYEAIRKKQIPASVKGIISVIGLGLLFLLMIFIIIKDIVGLIV